MDAIAPAPDLLRVCRFGEVEVFSGANWVVTILPPDRVVFASPNRDPESIARAADLGYPDVDAMTREHDPMHSRLCHALGLRASPSLAAAIDGLPPNELTDAEEAMVLAAQRFLNLCRTSGILVAAS